MKNYELLYIVSNQYTEDELKTVKGKIDSILQKYGGVLGFSESLGKKKLAYPISKINHGYYVVSEFELEDPTTVKAISNDLKLDKEILRAQIISKPKITQAEIERQKKQRARAAEEAKPKAEEKKTVKPKEVKKMEMKNLDDKLDEILRDDAII
ncbi:MAG: 30S ribosomal protein S6 [Candidatus Buchananbacteria bacterium]|nr:30S ribosomal protein S6 [Candidatus Buchananbacteria bacterium]